ncbi:uncharacterized protein LOC121388201 [Gigantopelta aegis]|uniref:uncharacterized protein LOC121388201 n=1 Tax=Gigantopelta aegis TaxID=1735272 RepID=UPI001B88B929|nr:uncharacterized protein LOC121388201 [Gigantopelta aegis]
MGTTSSIAKKTTPPEPEPDQDSESNSRIGTEQKQEPGRVVPAPDFEMFRFRSVPAKPESESEKEQKPGTGKEKSGLTDDTEEIRLRSSCQPNSTKLSGKTSRTSSVSSLRKASRDDSSKTTPPGDSSNGDLSVPESRDEVDASFYDPKMKEKYFDSMTKETKKAPEKKDTAVQIPAKNDEDLRAAKALVKKFPSMQDTFSNFDSAAVKLRQIIQNQFCANESQEELITLEQSFCIYDRIEERQALGDYLTLIDIPQLLYSNYDLIMKSLKLDHWTETILEDKSGLPEKECIYRIRSLLWNYTDASTLFGEQLTTTGIFQCYMKDLQAMKDDISETRKISYIFESAVSAIHNCSKNLANHHQFHKLEVVNHIIPYLKCNSPKVKMIVLLTLSYIISEDENELLLADENVHSFLIKYLCKAWNSFDHRFDGFAVDELVAGLMGLAKNDTNKKLLMENGALPILSAIMKSGSDAEKKPAIECIWELSFNKENQKTILADKEVVNLLTDLSKSDQKVIAKAASGALWVLGAQERSKKKQEEAKKSKTSPEKKIADHIMMSYAWADQKKVIQVKEYLRRSGFHIWMDIDNMGGSTLQAMAEAVEQSAVVLICMSDRYKQSQNCRNEAEYAFSMKKDIVPLLMERGYQPDGWLGMIKGTKLFFEFSGKYPFEKKIEDLVKELGARGKTLSEGVPGVENQIAVIKSAPLQAGKGATVAEWSIKDVQNWLEKNKLTSSSNSALKNLTGEQLEFLLKLSHRAPEFYFGYIERKLGLNSLEEMMKFSKAVDRL